jgi:hypothetical protein
VSQKALWQPSAASFDSFLTSTINLGTPLAMRVRPAQAMLIHGMIPPLENPWSLSSGGLNARVSEPIPRQVGMQASYSLCSQVSEESSLGPNPARIGRIFHQLCRQKEVGLVAGHALPDHVHMLLSIAPQHSVASVLGYLKGKSAQ